VDRAARDHLQRCFVLHRRDYGNTSLIVELFSASRGRLPVLAKGAKRGRCAPAAMLQPFRPLWASWTGRGEVHALTRSEPAGRGIELTGKALFCGFYLNELLVRLLERNDPHEDLFAFYCAALTSLSSTRDLETVLRQFELRLLDEIGYAPVLDREGGGGEPVRPGVRYACDVQAGLRRKGVGEAGGGYSGETLLGLAAGEQLCGDAAREARTLMRDLLAPHLGPRPLKSRELFRRWRSRPDGRP
jgi:DNA repair protein RecO (recombination protein O)